MDKAEELSSQLQSDSRWDPPAMPSLTLRGRLGGAPPTRRAMRRLASCPSCSPRLRIGPNRSDMSFHLVSISMHGPDKAKELTRRKEICNNEKAEEDREEHEAPPARLDYSREDREDTRYVEDAPEDGSQARVRSMRSRVRGMIVSGANRASTHDIRPFQPSLECTRSVDGCAVPSH